MKCDNCDKNLEENDLRFKYAGKILCEECLEEESLLGEKCPHCGAGISLEDGVSLILAHPDASPERQDIATRVTVNVCPRCHIMFFDGFAYAVLKGLKA